MTVGAQLSAPPHAGQHRRGTRLGFTGDDDDSMAVLDRFDPFFERLGHSTDHRRVRVALWVLCVALLLGGLRITLLEGVIFSWGRAFFGDFYAVMFHPYWWDGSGIVYGPIFVFERWLRLALPDLLTIYGFAMLNIPLATIAFVAGAAACRLSRPQTIVALAMWLASWPLTFALSVSANPEFVELMFLSLAWLAASRGRRALEGALVAAAALTKIIPGIFVIPGLARPGRVRFVLGGAAVTAVMLVIVAVGQGLGPVELARELLIPSGKSGGTSVAIASIAFGSQSSPEITGLHAALTRFAFGFGLGSPQTTGDASPLNYAVQAIALVTLAVMLVAAGWLAVRLRRAPRPRATTITYALFFALLPHATHNSHPHTWVFLVPVWTALVALLWEDPDVGRRTRYAFGFALAYAYVSLRVIPALSDRLFGTHLSTVIGQEPVWGALAVVVLLLAYARPRGRSEERSRATPAGFAVIAPEVSPGSASR